MTPAHDVNVTRPDKVLFPEAGITKGELVDYYARIAPTMLSHLRDRPVALKRYPDGLDGEGFFQKNASAHFPAWIRREQIRKRDGGTLDHVVVDETDTIVYLAGQAAIEFHPWLAAADDLEHPVELVFDLDPPEGADPAGVRTAARHVREVLDDLEAPARLKTSGSSGFHLHVALDGTVDWKDAGALARRIAVATAARHPGALTTNQRVAARRGRVFIDWLRNAYGQTSVAAYSVRALPDAPVATPIAWHELGEVTPRSYHLGNLFRRLGQRDDPWARAGPPADPERLAAALEQLEAAE